MFKVLKKWLLKRKLKQAKSNLYRLENARPGFMQKEIQEILPLLRFQISQLEKQVKDEPLEVAVIEPAS